MSLAACAGEPHPRIAFASTAHDEGALEAKVLAPAASPQPKPKNDARIILVTIDGVRAEDVFEGADPTLRPASNVERFARPEAVMPRLHQIVAERGVALGADKPGCGVVRTAGAMNVSLPGYLEIFTGRKTRCRDNQCARVAVPTVLDEAAASGLSVASIGSWDILDRAVSRGSATAEQPGPATSKVFVAEGAQRWPGKRPLMSGNMEELVAAGEHADAFPGSGKYRPDALTAAIALEYFRTNAPEVFHVGLGDSDEWAHRNDYPAYLEATAKADAFVGKLADMLDSMGAAGAGTTVIVTTDHGRNRDFQHHGAFSLTSARTFVIAFGAHVPAKGIVCPVRDVSLADIAPTIRTLLGLPADASADAGRPIAEIAAPAPSTRDHLVAGGAASGGGGSGAGVLQVP